MSIQTYCSSEPSLVSFFTNDGGSEWKQLKAGVPTVAVRDIDIQRRENDLVLGTFGRGFYVLDDYSALRTTNNESLEGDAILYPVRDAFVFESRYPLGLPFKSFQGDDYWQGENLGSEVLFTYYIKEKPRSIADTRREKEKEVIKAGDEEIYVPTYEELKAEREEEGSKLYFTITNSQGNIIRKLDASPGEGVQRLKWDMRTASKDPISLRAPSFYNPWAGKDEGHLVPPGEYTVILSLWNKGETTQLGEPQSFTIKALDNKTLPAESPEALAAFKADATEVSRALDGTMRAMSEVDNEIKHIRKAITQIEVPSDELMDEVRSIEIELRDIRKGLVGDGVASTLDIYEPPSVATRVGYIIYEQKYSSSSPTGTAKASLQIAKEEFKPLLDRFQAIAQERMPALRKSLSDAGAPYTPNALPDLMKD